MVDSCYVCRRTQADLDRLNEELRTRVYLSYFSNAHAQIEERQRRITFLQRLRDEESTDAHFRIPAAQVFTDPPAYKKLMPWIDTLMEIAGPAGPSRELRGSIGELVESLLAEERRTIGGMEEGLNQIRGGFATTGRSPLTLRKVTCALPVEWSVEGHGVTWRPAQASDREPLHREPGAAKATVDLELHICTACERILKGP